jgi:hypothetical protein
MMSRGEWSEIHVVWWTNEKRKEKGLSQWEGKRVRENHVKGGWVQRAEKCKKRAERIMKRAEDGAEDEMKEADEVLISTYSMIEHMYSIEEHIETPENKSENILFSYFKKPTPPFTLSSVHYHQYEFSPITNKTFSRQRLNSGWCKHLVPYGQVSVRTQAHEPFGSRLSAFQRRSASRCDRHSAGLHASPTVNSSDTCRRRGTGAFTLPKGTPINLYVSYFTSC